MNTKKLSSTIARTAHGSIKPLAVVAGKEMNWNNFFLPIFDVSMCGI
jgi:hypothetical protein